MEFTHYIDELSDAVISTDINFKINIWNKAAELLYGWKNEEVLGKHIEEIFQSSSYDYVRDIVIEHLANFGEWRGKLVHKNKNGEELEISSVSKTIKAANGNLLGFLWLCRTADEIEKIKSEVKLTKERMSALTEHLNSIREEERTSIAREVHDELGQVLTTLKMDIYSIAEIVEPNVATRLERSIGLIDDAINTVRKISTELRPPMLDHLGLVATIEWQLGEFQKRTKIECSHSLQKELKLNAKNFNLVIQDISGNIDKHYAAFKSKCN